MQPILIPIASAVRAVTPNDARPAATLPT